MWMPFRDGIPKWGARLRMSATDPWSKDLGGMRKAVHVIEWQTWRGFHLHHGSGLTINFT
jgi:hypothetical protein